MFFLYLPLCFSLWFLWAFFCFPHFRLRCGCVFVSFAPWFLWCAVNVICFSWCLWWISRRGFRLFFGFFFAVKFVLVWHVFVRFRANTSTPPTKPAHHGCARRNYSAYSQNNTWWWRLLAVSEWGTIGASRGFCTKKEPKHLAVLRSPRLTRCVPTPMAACAHQERPCTFQPCIQTTAFSSQFL